MRKHQEGAITTAPESATQRATWHHRDSAMVDYFAAVTLSDETDDAGRVGWAYELGVSIPESVGFHYTFARPSELIYTHSDVPFDALATLASFVGAWDESRRYGTPDSENWGLFPESCVRFLDGAEEFGYWGYEHENEEEEVTS